MSDARQHVVVDLGLCSAYGVCVSLVPEVFELDDDLELHVLQPVVPDPLANAVGEAVRQCPKMALALRP